MMKYDWEKNIERKHTDSMKWDGVGIFLGEKAKDAIPMWVADMDHQVPQPVIDAMMKQVQHGIFGYNIVSDGYYDAVIGWMKRHYDYDVKKEWIHYCPGIVPALNYLVQVFSKKGEGVLIQSPVYYPFTDAIVNNERKLVLNNLKFEQGRYTMDITDLEKQIVDNNVKIMILCNPHNPVGRVWTKDELIQVGTICLKHNVLCVSDEIHADLTYEGYKTTAFLSISEEFRQHFIACTAASKTFNLAGLQNSNIIIPNKELGDIFHTYMVKTIHLMRANTFGLLATQVAYEQGDEWLEQLKEHLQKNLDFLTAFIKENIPEIDVIKPEGTYLIWLDCHRLGMSGPELKAFMLEKAHVAFDDGYLFGPGGEGFTRINIACPQATLKKALTNISCAIKNR